MHSIFKPSQRAGRIELPRGTSHEKERTVQEVINFVYAIRGDLFFWSLMGLVIVWICDLFGLWQRWGR